jgi:hypothetical protein
MKLAWEYSKSIAFNVENYMKVDIELTANESSLFI